MCSELTPFISELSSHYQSLWTLWSWVSVPPRRFNIFAPLAVLLSHITCCRSACLKAVTPTVTGCTWSDSLILIYCINKAIWVNTCIRIETNIYLGSTEQIHVVPHGPTNRLFLVDSWQSGSIFSAAVWVLFWDSTVPCSLYLQTSMWTISWGL